MTYTSQVSPQSNSDVRITNEFILNAISDLPNKQTLLNEANYGLKYIHPYLEQLKNNSNVLEVGSGPCILLSHISSEYPALRITGIEPIGLGFDNFKKSISALKSHFKFHLFEDTYNKFDRTPKYDLIFLINVFEHLPDWNDFLIFAKNALKSDGKCIILCPNYSFPYEPHFGIPIIFGKTITQSIFRSYIKRFEEKNSSHGLWESLNFVKLKHVKKASRQLGLNLTLNTKIINDLIDRFSYDLEFIARQRIIGKIAIVLKRFGILSLLNTRPFILYQPYMFLEISLTPPPHDQKS